MEKTLSLQSKECKSRKNRFIFFLIATAVLLVAQIWIHPGTDDDALYRGFYTETPFWEFLRYHYEQWSSRVIIEAALYPMVMLSPWVWRTVNIVMILLLVWNVGDMLSVKEEDSLSGQVIFFLLMWVVPFFSLRSAGWIVTTANYLWPLSLGLLSLRPIMHLYKGRDLPTWEMVICPLALIYASNMELMGAIILGTYLSFGLFFLLGKKKIRPYHIFMTLLAIASICFVMLCPGNASRTSEDILNYFPEFAGMSFVGKAVMGFIETGHYYLAGGHGRVCFVFALCSLVLFATFCAVNHRKPVSLRKILCVIACAVPFVSYLMFAYFFDFLLNTVHVTKMRNLLAVLSTNRQVAGQGQFSQTVVGVQVAVYLTVLVFLAFTVFLIHGLSTETLLEIFIISVGFISRIVMGFSPTIYASGDRTALFCSVALLIVSMRNLQFLIKAVREWNVNGENVTIGVERV